MNYMQYSPDIVERIETLTFRALEKRRVMQDFIGVLQDRVNLEDYYSRNLEKIGESLNRLIHGRDQMKDIFLLLRNYIMIQAEQSRSLARSIKNDVANEIQALLKKESPWQKDVQQLAKRHQKEVRTYIDKLNAVRTEYVYSIQEEMGSKYAQRPRFPKSRSHCESQLRSYIDVYNRYIDEYFSDIAAVQDTFTKLEVERRQCVQDSTMKLLMYEVSFVRNLQYDLNGITNKLEQYNPRKDLSELFQEPKNDKPLLCKLNFTNYQTFLHQQLEYNPAPAPTQQAPQQIGPPEAPQFTSELKKRRPIFEELPVQQSDGSNPLLMKMFQTAFFNNIVSDQAIQTLEDRIKSDGTILSSFVVSLDRVMALSINQQQGVVYVDPNGYVAMNRILTSFLNNVTSQHINDVAAVMQMSGSIFKRVIQPDDERVVEEISLYHGLQLHPLFADAERLFTFGCSLASDIDTINKYTQLLQGIGCTPQVVRAVCDAMLDHFNIEDSMRERLQSQQPIASTQVEESEIDNSVFS